MTLGFALTWLVYIWIYSLQARGLSAAALGMSDMHMNDMNIYWSFPILQASGMTGLAFAYVSVFLGLQQTGSGRVRLLPFSPQRTNLYHQQVSVLVLTLVVIHVTATAFDAMGDNWRTVLLLNQWRKDWPEAVLGYNTGIVAAYLLVVLGPTFYVRRLVGSARWQVLHRFVAVFYILSFWHAMILGLDVAFYTWIRPLMWLSQIPLLALLIDRLQALSSSQKTVQRKLLRFGYRGLAAISAGAIGAILALVATGHSGFIKTV